MKKRLSISNIYFRCGGKAVPLDSVVCQTVLAKLLGSLGNQYLWEEIIFIASYYRQLSADIKMKNSYVSPKGPKVWANKTDIYFLIV